jgi:ABC-2 type transport system ATP-binding protein
VEATALSTEELGGIAVRDLGKTYPGGVEALDSVSFDASGETFGLLGPNGAGKSTTIGILTTTVRPTRGTARICGFDVATDPLDARSLSSVLFQESVVDRPLTGRRHLELHARLWGASPSTARRRISEMVDLFELGGLIDRAVGTYSGGERRRLEIAARWSRAAGPVPRRADRRPDPRSATSLDVISSLREPVTTILLTTHYLEEAERLSDRPRSCVVRTHRRPRNAGRARLLDRRGGRGAPRALMRLALRTLRRVASLTNAFTVGATIAAPVRDRAPDEVTPRRRRRASASCPPVAAHPRSTTSTSGSPETKPAA